MPIFGDFRELGGQGTRLGGSMMAAKRATKNFVFSTRRLHDTSRWCLHPFMVATNRALPPEVFSGFEFDIARIYPVVSSNVPLGS
jgi:hypothetical protein